MSRPANIRRALLILTVTGLIGCRASPREISEDSLATLRPVAGLTRPHYSGDLRAVVAPPEGWNIEIRDDSTTRGHHVWVSPSGRTAYGVAHFNLPLPVGHDPVLWVFMREMRRSEGEAELISRDWDPNQKMLRFVAKGGLYTVRTNLIVRGFNGWTVYAGTLTGQPVMPEELALAERAKELTLIGRLPEPDAGIVPSPGPDVVNLPP